ncbi:LLM class flavin-dependent oxidoreductase [Serratia quinivorans]|uniref:LLM class flavin-dependent oxidoreductase n=1 Tax=Serratia quinivorans TaxID=137545 RepID=UPI001C46FB46|nr:LLM class flavin-dependent oxidoreductase [Serratia quinivorans]MBV6691501.1 LLM class flavin-dependent oxidoreductase [Serratia quinivorans]
MAYALSVLEKSPIAEGESAAQALTRTLHLAQQAEIWGYRRFWLAEHHNTAQLACPSPEVLIAYLLGQTSRIRIGSGGVMLQHYSAYKVAENFNLLATLAPGRVDLGVGKAPGGLPLSTQALQAAHDQQNKPDFPQQLAQLNAYLNDDAQPGLSATPQPSQPAQRFLLGASKESAQLAAEHGWAFVFAAQLNGNPDDIQRALAHYAEQSGGRKALLAVAVIVANTPAQAQALAAGIQQYRVHVAGGQSVTVGSLEQAESYVQQAGATDYRIEPCESHILLGTAQQVRSQLDQLQQQYGVEEFVIDTPISEPIARLTSLQLLAQA